MNSSNVLQVQPRSVPPWLYWLIIVVLIATTECGLMFLLPWMWGSDVSLVVEAISDSILLTLVVAPVLWWMIVRPLQRAAKLRDAFLADLFSTIEEERRRIAHELHDGVGQSLTMLASGLRSIPTMSSTEEVSQRTAELQEIAQRALSDTKQLALGLRPSILDDLGLCFAIEKIVAEARQHCSMNVVAEVQDQCHDRLPDAVATTLFRISQEALANAIKHSRATRVLVRLSRSDDMVSLVIEDDGCGIEPARMNRLAPLDGHLGLIGMSERANLQGGTLLLDTSPGKGTRIEVWIPLETHS